VSKPLRVAVDDLQPGVQPLAATVARYVTRVHRLRVGDRLSLFDPAASSEADAVLVDGAAPDVWCRVEALRPSGYRPLPIRLIQGLGKADKPDEVIRAATALGVAKVTLVQTARSVARPLGERAGVRLERWRRIAIEAARQSGRGDIPALEGPLALTALLSSEDGAALRVVLAPDARPLFERLAAWPPNARLELLVGPEGGFDHGEQLAIAAAGFLPASLGTTTLRTELAGVAALGALVALSALRGGAPGEALAPATREQTT
jgi:16S rRNA (uracil1498-N3)-methyltransferase